MVGLSDVETPFDDVAVFHDVFFAFDAEFAFFAAFGVGAEFGKVVEGDDFGGDEAAFEVAMDDASGLWGFHAFGDGPGSGFFFAGGEIGLESEKAVDTFDEAGDAAVGDAEVLEVLGGFFGFEVDEFAFDVGADDDGAGGVGVVGVVADFADERVFFGIVAGGGEFVFRDVASVDAGFAAEEEERFEEFTFVVAELQGDGGFAVVEVRDEFVAEGEFGLGFLVAAFGFFFVAVATFGDAVHVGEDQLGVDDFDVADGIDGAVDVVDVGAFEAAHDVDDGVDFTDVAEELVAEAFAFAGTFDEAGDVDEFDGGVDEFGGFGDAAEDFQSFIRHSDDALVGLDGAEWIVGCFRFTGACDGVEKG